MIKNKKVPKIRFPEFSGDWEEKKLGEVADIRTGNSDLQDSISNGKYPFFVRSQNIEKSNRYLYDGEAILIPGEGKLGDIYHHIIGKFDFHQRVYKISDFKNVYGLFILYDMKKNFKKHALKYTVKATVDSLRLPILKEYYIYMPSLLEQQKIGNFFKKLDDSITLQKKKIENLKLQKKGLLQKMFPKNGETVPEIRFPEFSGEWEDKKFGEILNSKDGIRRGPFGSSLKKEFFIEKSEFVVYEQQNAIYNRFNTRYNISKEKYEELKNFSINVGDFIMSGAGTIGKISRVPDGIKKGVFNQALIRIRINIKMVNSEYFLQFMRSDIVQQKLTSVNPGSAMSNLVPMVEIKEWKLKIPNFPEQQKIGNFFKKLDDLINLNQRKLENLEKRKKALLQQMFI